MKKLKEGILFKLDHENEDSDWEFEMFLDSLKERDTPTVVTGYFMTWNGKQYGGKIFHSLRAAVGDIVMEESTPIFSVTKEGDMILDEAHHDAPVKGNHYEFRIITTRGMNYLNTHQYESRRTLCEKLFNTPGYSRRVKEEDRCVMVID